MNYVYKSNCATCETNSLCHVLFLARQRVNRQRWARLVYNPRWRHQMEICYWPFVRGIHLSPVNSPHKGQWRGALMFSLICIGTNDWVNNRDAGDLRRHRAHYDAIVMYDNETLATPFGCRFGTVNHDTLDIFVDEYLTLWIVLASDQS